MRVRDILNGKRTFSMEFFPPKLEEPLEPLIDTLDRLDKYKADFISVTYGAGGTNKGRNNEICQYVLSKNQTLVSHFTGIGNSRDDVKRRVQKYVDMGAKNILALRGDIPAGWSGTRGDYENGTLLIEDIAKYFPQLCIGGGCYPEKHTESPNVAKDVDVMKLKENAGCEFFVTQLCYDLEAYEKFMDLTVQKNIKSPIIVGVLPALAKKVLLRITSENDCNIPKELQCIIDKYDGADFKVAGMEYTKQLIDKYIDMGVSGIHLYTMNKWDDSGKIIEDTKLMNLK